MVIYLNAKQYLYTISQDSLGQQNVAEGNRVEIDTRIFYKKLRFGAGRQFLNFSRHFAIKSFLHVS